MTNGGFVEMKSKVSPSTASKKLPCRHSMFATPLRSALNAVTFNARGLMSVATTRRACCAASRAWTPVPVPRSSAASTGRRIVNCASRTVGALIPGTQAAGIEDLSAGIQSLAISKPSRGVTVNCAVVPPPFTSIRPIDCTRARSSGASAADATASGTESRSWNRRTSVASGLSSRRRREHTAVSSIGVGPSPDVPSSRARLSCRYPARRNTSPSNLQPPGSSRLRPQSGFTSVMEWSAPRLVLTDSGRSLKIRRIPVLPFRLS